MGITVKDYADIQRNLGYIEGLIADSNIIVANGVTSAVEAIDEIISKNIETEKPEGYTE